MFWGQTESITQSVRRWCSSRCQLLDCLAHEVVEVVQPLPVQSPVEGGTNVNVSQPKFDVIHLVDHRVPCAFQTAIDELKARRRHTLTIVRIKLTKPKTILAGVVLENSFARFKASMAAFNGEIALSRPLP